ncbi:MAG: thermonuclease family protein [Betaproteobacteria bacterium]
MYKYNAKLIRVIDGDTIDALIDLGFDVWIKKRIRLYGINTPETRTRDLEEKKAGLAAEERLIALLWESGNEFVLESHGVGKYGRCLGVLFIGETNINTLLLSEGLAEEYK